MTAAEYAIAWEARALGIRLGTVDVELAIIFHTRRPLRGDLDNYTKTILDGLEKGQAIENDRQVKSLSAQFVIDPDAEDRTVIRIRPLPSAA